MKYCNNVLIYLDIQYGSTRLTLYDEINLSNIDDQNAAYACDAWLIEGHH